MTTIIVIGVLAFIVVAAATAFGYRSGSAQSNPTSCLSVIALFGIMAIMAAIGFAVLRLVAS